jgi:peroxiredoxin
MFLCLFVSNLISCSGEKEPGQLGQAIPFTLPAVDSVKYNLQDYRDKIVLLHFWADWCPHCRKEFAKLQKASDELEGQGLEILAINVGQDREHVLELKQEYQLTIPLLLDDKKEVAENYGVTGLPTSFFIDSRGKIREKIIGWLTEGKIRSVFEKIAAGN